MSEREVMALTGDGLANKAIADSPGLGVRTVEVLRARIFEKLHMRSAGELGNLLPAFRR